MTLVYCTCRLKPVLFLFYKYGREKIKQEVSTFISVVFSLGAPLYTYNSLPKWMALTIAASSKLDCIVPCCRDVVKFDAFSLS